MSTRRRSPLGCVLAGLVWLPIARATINFVCPTPVVIERVDPITNAGGIGPHIHAVYGSSGFGKSVTSAGLKAASCSTCPVPADRSAYWAPQLYFAHSNGSYTLVQSHCAVYWFDSGEQKRTPPPDDLRIVAGTSSRRAYDPTAPDMSKVTWRCQGDESHGAMMSLPNWKCPAPGLRGQVLFPECSNGQLDSPDHKSHMAYADNSTRCPDSHPTLIPTPFIEMHFQTHLFSDQWDSAANTSQPFILSNLDTTGFGMHADWFNGFDQTAFQEIMDECGDNGSEALEDCHVIKPIDTATLSQCSKTSEVDEPVLGTIANLPVGGTTSDGSASTDGDTTETTTSDGSITILPSSTSSRSNPFVRNVCRSEL